MKLVRLTAETTGDVCSFLRAARRDMTRAEGYLNQSVWRKEKAFKVISRTDYALSRLHLQRVQRVLQSLEHHLVELEYLDQKTSLEATAAENDAADQNAMFTMDPGSMEEDFTDPFSEERKEIRISQRMYDH